MAEHRHRARLALRHVEQRFERAAGPAISRRKSGAIHKPFEHAGKRIGPGDEAEVAGALEHHVLGAGEVVQVASRHSTGTTLSSPGSPVTTSVGA